MNVNPTEREDQSRLAKPTREGSGFVQSGLGSAIIKVLNLILVLSISIVLARALGPGGYGEYVFVFAVISILAIIGQLGVPRLIVRETAKALINMEWPVIRGVWIWSVLVTGFASLLIILIVGLSVWLWEDSIRQFELSTMIVGLIMLPLLVIGTIREAALQGLHYIIVAQLAERVVRPALFFLTVVLLVHIYEDSLSASDAIGLHAVAAVIAFVVGTWLLLFRIPPELKKTSKSLYRHREWVNTMLPLALVAGLQQLSLHTDLIMLGILADNEHVGIYRVATQGALLIAFGLQIVSMYAAPNFARLYANKEWSGLQQLAAKSARYSFCISIPLALIIFVWGEDLISLIFGQVYSDAYLPLLVLVASQLVNCFFGPIGLLLNMTGFEKETALGVALAVILNIFLNFLLIPDFGMFGAASASALSLVLWNVFLWYRGSRRLGIRSSALASKVLRSDQ